MAARPGARWDRAGGRE